MDKQSFIDMILPGAIDSYNKYGILPSVTLSQAILESGWGESSLSTSANNLFGIKGSGTAGSVLMPTTEEVNGKTISILDNFRAYNNINESIVDHAELLGTAKRYEGVRTATDYKTAISALQNSGYATESDYGVNLLGVINSNSLYKYDEQVKGGTNVGATKTSFIFPSVTSGIDNIMKTIGDWLLRSSFVIIGGIILVLGIYFLLKE
jgi:lysozyme